MPDGRQSLGNLRTCEAGVWLTVGKVIWDFNHNTGLVGLDLRVVLPLCDRHEGEEMVWGVCVPYDNIKHPPLIHHDMQWSRAADKRVKAGFVFSKAEDTGDGAVKYIVAIDHHMLLKGGWRAGGGGMLWLHLHDPQKDESPDSEQKETE